MSRRCQPGMAQISDMMAYHGESKGGMSFKNKVRFEEFLEAQADPDSASARRGAKHLASGCFELAYQTASYFDGQ